MLVKQSTQQPISCRFGSKALPPYSMQVLYSMCSTAGHPNSPPNLFVLAFRCQFFSLASDAPCCPLCPMQVLYSVCGTLVNLTADPACAQALAEVRAPAMSWLLPGQHGVLCQSGHVLF